MEFVLDYLKTDAKLVILFGFSKFYIVKSTKFLYFANQILQNQALFGLFTTKFGIMNESIEEKKMVLNRLYIVAQGAGLCRNKKEFANLIDRNYTTVVAAMNGNENECNDNLIRIINEKLIKLGAIDRPIVCNDVRSCEKQKKSVLQQLLDSTREVAKMTEESRINPKSVQSDTDRIVSELHYIGAQLTRIANSLEDR